MSSDLLHDFIRTTQECGIQTRIIECRIPVDFTMIHSQTNTLESSDDIKFLQEYETLSAMGHDLIAQAMHFASKEKSTSLILVLELLVDLQQRLSKIESHILQEKNILLPLEVQGVLYGLGHGVLCVKESAFIKGRFYYARFCLPNFSQRVIGVFACAIAENILQIVRIHSHNTQAIDSFIVSMEMEQLRQRQLQQRIKNDD
ncbi:hypothetical protein [Helicobacter sp.]|uniref:hypothetical protein n=1 Tax=Helicobacter sp. TaxID=218 RepID=UPI0025BE6768|nr:hypothetical protein [Helicobacter sp.]MBR2494124.1 hypothetical protein [Helicobacter sp.]